SRLKTSISNSRAQSIEALTKKPLDLLIIGGGIVGSGIARDAAMRGLRVGLVEQYDFAFGTSSRSSRLLHGGLRYLAQGRVGLVLDTLRSAEKGGATLMNYVRFENAKFVSGEWEAAVEDKISPQNFSIRARAIVNATGAWADGLPHSEVKLRLTKGIHLVVER